VLYAARRKADKPPNNTDTGSSMQAANPRCDQVRVRNSSRLER